eukprot:gene13099-3886_t
MFHLPRCASVLTDDVDVQKFFRMLSSLDVNSKESLQPFLEKFGGVKFRVSGVSESVAITGNDSQSSPDFEQFSIDLWKEYYIQEDVYQLGILEDKSPLEGLFIGKHSGKVYICAQADDFSQQKVICIGDNLHNFIWVGPTPPVEYHSGSCILDGCYGCFDPVIRDRVLRFKR